MADKTITISILGGALQVSMSSVTAKPKTSDTVCFTCSNEFAVLFDNNRSPFTPKKKAIAGAAGTTTAKFNVRHLTSAEQGFPTGDIVNGAKFKYGVAVMEPGTGHVLTLDPDIIIDDPSGGGGGDGTKAKKKKATKKR